MKKLILGSSLFFVALSLTSCDFFGNDNWKERYGTPELFLNEITDRWCYIHMYNETVGDIDYNFEVRDALAEVGPFEQSNRKKSDVEKYFTYERYIGPSTTGPNYCLLLLYSDGFIKIDYKPSLGSHKYAYFEIDAVKAAPLVDFVFDKITNDRKAKLEDERAAMEEAKIENFLTAMEAKGSVKANFVEVAKSHKYFDEYASTPFTDNGELLNLMKEVYYIETEEWDYDHYVAMTYNYDDSEKEENYWRYQLLSSGDYVEIRYDYVNRFKENLVACISYRIDATKGNAILAKASELAKQ